MPLDLNNLAYPFDPTGRLLSNLIVDEQQIITGANFRDYHFVVPKLAPYFGDGLVVQYRGPDNIWRTLIEGIDYYKTHYFMSASRACATPIFGSISFLNVELAGVLKLKYQTIGGIWVQDDAKIAEIMADRLTNPRTTTWDQVVDMPVSFPVIDHEWDLVDMVGMSEVVDSIMSIEAALRQTGQTGISDHIANRDNPHQVTKLQVGLGNVSNFPLPDNSTAIAGVSNEYYMTPSLTYASIVANALTPFNAHKNNTDNPHNTTAAQVGAYSIAQSDTLLATKVSFGVAASDTLKFDGLLPLDFKNWVLEGTAANSLKFNGLTYGQAKADILAGTVNNTTHFEGYSLQQVKDQITQGGIDNAARFNGYTYSEAKADILGGTANNATRLNGLDAAALQSFILLGTAENASHLEGYDVSDLTDYLRVEIGNWEPIATEQGYFAENTEPGVGASRWINFTNIEDLTDGDTAQLLSNPEWIVHGGSAISAANPDADHLSSTFLLRVALTGPNNSSALIFARSFATCLSEVDNGITFGTTQPAGENRIRVWAKLPVKYKGFTCTQLAKGIDLLTNFDQEGEVSDTEPTGIVYATRSRMARDTDIAAVREEIGEAGGSSDTAIALLRADTESAIAVLTTAFQDLKNSIQP